MAVKLIPPQQNNALGLLGSNNPFSSGSLLQGSRLDVDPNLQTRTSSFNSLAELERFNQENQPGAGKNRFFKGLRDLGLALQGVNPTAYDVQQQQLLQAQEDENRKRQLIASLPESQRNLITMFPEKAFEVLYPQSTRNYKPELVNYKNTGTEVINIGNMALKPGQTMPFNVSIPEIANAISGTPNLEEDRNQVVYTRQGALYTTADGDYREIIQGGQRIFDGPKGQFDAGQFFAQYPESRSKTSGEEQRYIPDFKTFTGLSKELTEAERSMKKLENYFNNVADANIGFKRLGDQISVWAKTLAGSVDLTVPELAREIAEGQLQGLVGANRIDTVGGGVMTEKDAWRVVTRLGGDVTALQNPAEVAEQLRLVYSDKARQYNNDIKGYNLGVASKKYEGYDKRERIDQEKIDDLFNLLPPGIPKGSQKINKDGVTLYQDGDTFYAIQNDEVVIVDIDG